MLRRVEPCKQSKARALGIVEQGDVSAPGKACPKRCLRCVKACVSSSATLRCDELRGCYGGC